MRKHQEASAGSACIKVSDSYEMPAMFCSTAASMIFGQYFGWMRPERFISLAVDAPLPITAEKAVGPPNASINSGTEFIPLDLQNFC